MRAVFGVRAVFLLIGFTASIGQIVLLRELMVVFYGNEMSIGLMLASWLFWTAAGSGLAGRLAARARNPRRMVAGVETAIALVLPLTILVVRAVRSAWQTVPGEMLGPGPMLLTSLAALSLFCLLSGALFSAGSRLCTAGLAEATGSVYLWEALGSAAGGILAGLALVQSLGPFEIAGLLAAMNLVAAMNLWATSPGDGRPWRWGFLALLSVAALPALPKLERISLERLWRGFHLVAARNSAYGSLAVVGAEGNRSVYQNGVVLFTAPDPASAEESVQYALLEHPSPHSLLLIGGGLNGSVAQALQHPGIQRVDYVELDPAILELGRQYFPKEDAPLRTDPRVRVHVIDGRRFVNTTGDTFDVIIVNLPEPQTAQLNRFYTVEFFREAARKLAAGGVFSFRLTSSENYISPELAEFLRSIRKSLGTVFPEVTAIPGETIHFFAAKRAGVLAGGAAELLSRLRARNLQTSYVREYYIPFRMMPDRMRELESQIHPQPATPLNRDFAPVAYYFDVALWSSRFQQGYSHFFRALADVDFGRLAAGLGVLLVVQAMAGRRRRRVTAACCTVAMGFTLIGLEMLLLLAFQALYGYVYQQLAVIIAAFMAGMAMGSWTAMRWPAAREMRVLAAVQGTAAVMPLLLCAAFPHLGPLPFPALALVCGMLGGYEFPLASRIFFAAGRRSGAGSLYALDLAGSSLGAILFSTYLIPVFGFFKTAVLMAMVSLVPAAMAILPASARDPAE